MSDGESKTKNSKLSFGPQLLGVALVMLLGVAAAFWLLRSTYLLPQPGRQDELAYSPLDSPKPGMAAYVGPYSVWYQKDGHWYRSEEPEEGEIAADTIANWDKFQAHLSSLNDAYYDDIRLGRIRTFYFAKGTKIVITAVAQRTQVFVQFQYRGRLWWFREDQLWTKDK